LSRDGFLRSGLTTEFLKDIGNIPVDRDRFMILVIEGTRRVAQSLSKEVGIGSRSHCLF
jgi:hypothetical protein